MNEPFSPFAATCSAATPVPRPGASVGPSGSAVPGGTGDPGTPAALGGAVPHEPEGRYRSLVESAGDVIFSLRCDRRVTALNPAFEALTGWPCVEWIGRDFILVLHPDDRTAAHARFQTILQDGKPGRGEYRMRKSDGGHAVGEFIVVPQFWDGRILGLSGIGRDVTERRRAEEALQQSEEHYRELFRQACAMQERLRRLSDRILQVQEQERARISRDLHDEVGQALTAINVNLAVLSRALAGAPAGIPQRMADTRQLLEHTMETVHAFSRELRPAMLDDLGLLPALRSYLKDFSVRTGLAVDFRAGPEGRIERLDAGRKTVLYRVVQEGLNNAVKHARARRVSVEVGEGGGRLHLTIGDDGRGFAANGRPGRVTSGRLGLLGLAERVRLVNGELSVQSTPGQGTTLRVSIPFTSG